MLSSVIVFTLLAIISTAQRYSIHDANGGISWQDAKTACEAQNKKLAVIQTQADVDLLKQEIQMTFNPYWIGIYGVGNQFQFVGGSPICKNDVFTTVPTCTTMLQPCDEKCAYIQEFSFGSAPSNNGIVFATTNGIEYRLFDCNAKKYGYICDSGAPAFPVSCLTTPVGGDVHFSTFENEYFTYNGAGDHIYVKNDKMDIHTRSVMMPNYSSVLAAIGIRDNERKINLEIWWKGKSSHDVVFNSRKVSEKYNHLPSPQNTTKTRGGVIFYDIDPFVILKFSDTHHFEIKHKKYPEFYLSGLYFGRATFKVKLPQKWMSSVTGLAGTKINGKFYLCSKSGQECAKRELTTNRQIHEIASSWRVDYEEKDHIFENRMKITKDESDFHDISFSIYDMEKAKKFCGNHKLCLFDFLATKGDKNFAKHTLNDFPENFVYLGNLL